MKENRKIRRCLLPAVLAAVTALTVSCTEYLEKEAPAPEAGSDGSVVFNAMLGDMKVSVPTRASGKAYGFEDFDEFVNEYEYDAPSIPILIRQWKKPKASTAWTYTDALYTDKSTVAGSLASYPADIFNDYFATASLVVSNDNIEYDPFSSWEKSLPGPLTWGGAEDQSCFSAWTPVVRTYYINTNNAAKPKEHVEDWVYMDPPESADNGKEYGTVKFFRWTLDGGSSTRLRDTLYVGWSSGTSASLNNFIGISGQVIDEAADTDVRHTHAPHMIGNTEGNEVNPPLMYRTNGASVSMRFQHLVSYINISAITITKSDGDVVSLGTHWAAVVDFPNLPRYARFTTGDPTTGEAPHLLEVGENDPHASTFKDYLKKNILTHEVHNRGGGKSEGWFNDEYTSILERTGLASYWNQTMYVPPFNLSDDKLSEFVVYVVAKDSTDSYSTYKYYKWDGDPNKDGSDRGTNRTYTIDTRYYGNLSSIAESIKSQKQAMLSMSMDNVSSSSDKLTWLEAGEGLKLNLQLADGKVTGITVSIQGWGSSSGSETETHSRTGIFSVNDLNDFCDGYWRHDDPPYPYVPEGLADKDKNIYLYDDLVYNDHTQLELKMRGDGYTLHGQGHVITCTDFHERGDNKNKGNIFDLFIESTTGSNDHSAWNGYKIFWYDFDGHLHAFDNWEEAFAERDRQLEERGGV